MKDHKRVWGGCLAFLSLLSLLALSGCGGSAQKVFRQAELDLSEGSYVYALQEFETCLENETQVPFSYRGVGICRLRMGDYQGAIEAFTDALHCEKVSKGLQKDLLSYRITARLPLGQLEEAMEDCKALAEVDALNADGYFLTARVDLAMNYYDEARLRFEDSYLADPTYDRAIQIYEVYVEKGMEADGTHFLELSLNRSPKTAEDYCECGKVYYYMEDYDNARKVLIEAQKRGSKEAILLLGMAYMGKEDYGNARAMYTQFINQTTQSGRGYNGLALCDIAQGDYEGARAVIQEGVPHANTQELQALLFNEVVSYEREYNFAAAQQKAEEYMTLFPEDAEMARELTFLRSRTSQQ